MDAKRIESFAVTAVEECVLNAGNFNPVFNKNDTLPSWDGDIYVYKGQDLSKKELIEVIPVQIKGTTQNKRKDGKFNYSVEVADLKIIFLANPALFCILLFILKKEMQEFKRQYIIISFIMAPDFKTTV